MAFPVIRKKKKTSDLFEQYIHEYKDKKKSKVWVIKSLKGKHRKVCLCSYCKKFKPEDRNNNCPTANTIFSLCVLKNLCLPVWECEDFEEM